jgi:tRNA G10  N-methylase Trm11
MFKYFFILGQNKNLSIAEIVGKFVNAADFGGTELANGVLIVESKKELNPTVILSELGGTVKVGEILKPLDDLGCLNAKEIIARFSFNDKKKIYFGFSPYGFLNNAKPVKQIQKLAIALKKELKERNFASRWVTSKEPQLSSVIVKKNRLLEQGAEIIFIQTKNKIYLGKTLAVQEFADYSFRDYGRPARDRLSGMLPPKLAKIMVNLAGIKKSDAFLDPFCGSGTILSEATMLGYQNLIGADISQKAIADTRKNLEWLRRNYHLLCHCEPRRRRGVAISRINQVKYRLFKSDVSYLSQKIEPNSISAIATEPYLGPAKILKSEEEARKVIAELSELYLKSFQEFKKVLKPRAKIVIILPILKIKNNLFQLPILDEIKRQGFKTELFLPSFWPSDLVQTTVRGSLIYSRPDQHVLREIFIFSSE